MPFYGIGTAIGTKGTMQSQPPQDLIMIFDCCDMKGGPSISASIPFRPDVVPCTVCIENLTNIEVAAFGRYVHRIQKSVSF